MKILYLYSEIVGYNIPCFKMLVDNYNCEVHVVHWNHKKLKPFTPPSINNVFFYDRTSFSTGELLSFSKELEPNLIMMSGWMDLSYLFVGAFFVKKNIPVVCGLDDKWEKTLKQRIGSIIFPFLKRFLYSHAWVAGPLQFEYAKKIGFKNKQIIFDSLSCDFLEFQRGSAFLKFKEKSYPKTFLYVGNFSLVKGTELLIEAFKIYQNNYKGDWKLICIGNGPDLEKLVGVKNILLHSFMSQEELINITKGAGVFILPSRHEQWGVVIHEFTSAGLPLIISDNVGSAPVFFVERYNGVSFNNNSAVDLAKAMWKMSIKPDSELIEMSKNSIEFSKRITPSTQAANLMSVI
jgi:glycosyltransferase involved in cell wall biosynthesis